RVTGVSGDAVCCAGSRDCSWMGTPVEEVTGAGDGSPTVSSEEAALTLAATGSPAPSTGALSAAYAGVVEADARKPPAATPMANSKPTAERSAPRRSDRVSVFNIFPRTLGSMAGLEGLATPLGRCN